MTRSLEPTFTRGEIVYLKSGGPAMTVVYEFLDKTEAIEKYDYVACGWFWRGKYFSERFKAGILTRTPSAAAPEGTPPAATPAPDTHRTGEEIQPARAENAQLERV
jgi:uncharacterized protein YodC (DUF2158 family)